MSNYIAVRLFTTQLEKNLQVYRINNVKPKQSKRTMSNNFDLSKDEFQDLRNQLLNGRELLFEQIFLTHFDDCRNLLVRKYRCSPEDAYDVTMDTLIVFRQKIIEGKIDYNNLRYLFTTMASQAWIRQEKKRKKQSSVSSTTEEPVEIDKELVKKVFGKLGENCRQLLKKVYFEDQPLKEIAEYSDSSYAAIRKQKERCISSLRLLFRQYSQVN